MSVAEQHAICCELRKLRDLVPGMLNHGLRMRSCGRIIHKHLACVLVVPGTRQFDNRLNRTVSSPWDYFRILSIDRKDGDIMMDSIR